MRLIDADTLISLIKMGECNMYDEYCQGRNGGIEFAVNQVKQMPTIEERKTGRWILDNRPGGGFWVCSECKFPSEAFAANVLYKFCPNCGAYMGGEQDETD